MFERFKEIFLKEKKGDLDSVFLHNPRSILRDLEPDASEYYQVYEKKVEYILSGQQLAWLDALFMPPPSFPEVPVSLENKDLCFGTEAIDRQEAALRIDLYIGDVTEFSGSVKIAGVNLEVTAVNGKAGIKSEGEVLVRGLQTQKGHFSLSVLKQPSNFLIWVTGKKCKLLCQCANSNRRLGDFRLKVENEVIGFVGFQCWSESGSIFKFGDEKDFIKSFAIKSSPFWVRQWEERARKLWHLSLAIRVCADINQETRRTKTEALSENMRLIVRLIHLALGAFPYWRAAESKHPRPMKWERGNWSSGFLCGAYGITAGLLMEMEEIQLDRVRIIESALNKGSGWLAGERHEPLATCDFPPVAHWVKRSTNHGVVILASALVGLREVQRVFYSQKLAKHIEKLDKEFWLLINHSFKNGMYLEGIRYAQFSLQEAAAYIIYDYGGSSTSFHHYIKERCSELIKIADFFLSAAYPGSNIPLVNWGDCATLPWKRSVLNFVDCLSGVSEESITQKVLLSRNKTELLPHLDGEVLKTEPLTLPTKVLMNSQFGGELIANKEEYLLTDAIAKVERTDVVGVASGWQLYAITTPIHLTHNKDHDTAGFCWATNGKLLIGEAFGRGAFCHSVPGIKNKMLFDERDEYSCYGATSNGELADRWYRGQIQVREVSALVNIMTAMSPHGLLFEDAFPKVTSFQRDWIIIGYQNPLLLVVTRMCVSAGQGYLTFVCPWGVQVDPFSLKGTLGDGEGEITSLVPPVGFKKVAKNNQCNADRVIEDWEGEENIVSVVKLNNSSGYHACHTKEGAMNSIHVEGNGWSGRICIPQTGEIEIEDQSGDA